MIQILHNPKCSKSRQTLELLEQWNIEPEIRLYLEKPLSEEELNQILLKLDVQATDLIRRNEQEFKDYINKFGTINNDQAIELMINHPKTMERPIVINNEKAKIGRPPESVLEIL